METIADKPEQKPFLGSNLLLSDLFLDWATWHGVRSIALQLTALRFVDRGPKEALGGILLFLTRRDMFTVLRHWSQASRQIRSLAYLPFR